VTAIFNYNYSETSIVQYQSPGFDSEIIMHLQFIIPIICIHNTVQGDPLISTLIHSIVETSFEIFFFLLNIVILLQNKM